MSGLPSIDETAYAQRAPPGTSAYAISFSSSSPGNSFTDGYFMISFRAIFQAFWTLQDRERSWRVASSWISFSMSSGKKRDCFRLSEPAIRELVSMDSLHSVKPCADVRWRSRQTGLPGYEPVTILSRLLEASMSTAAADSSKALTK